VKELHFPTPDPLPTSKPYRYTRLRSSSFLSTKFPPLRPALSSAKPSLSLSLAASFTPRLAMEAPLSSPSLSQPSQYFQGAPSTSASQASSYTSQPAASANQAQTPNQQQTQTQRGVSDGDTVSPFLRDFNLVAEAAKRAQMAVLMRDMEAVGL